MHREDQAAVIDGGQKVLVNEKGDQGRSFMIQDLASKEKTLKFDEQHNGVLVK